MSTLQTIEHNIADIGIMTEYVLQDFSQAEPAKGALKSKSEAREIKEKDLGSGGSRRIIL